jgi:hypothetical protein
VDRCLLLKMDGRRERYRECYMMTQRSAPFGKGGGGGGGCSAACICCCICCCIAAKPVKGEGCGSMRDMEDRERKGNRTCGHGRC